MLLPPRLSSIPLQLEQIFDVYSSSRSIKRPQTRSVFHLSSALNVVVRLRQNRLCCQAASPAFRPFLPHTGSSLASTGVAGVPCPAAVFSSILAIAAVWRAGSRILKARTLHLHCGGTLLCCGHRGEPSSALKNFNCVLRASRVRLALVGDIAAPATQMPGGRHHKLVTAMFRCRFWSVDWPWKFCSLSVA